ncbi:hypothetical protein [Pseudaminobacter sp. NGMCC 1.201702]|uniref:hypothetical protein n=1 Tax=Pseudaminobacter sp. NGMCC 1.201702 TaxID=3391825 RepID=UPI0039EF2832
MKEYFVQQGECIMKTFTITLAAAFVSCSAIAAQAGGWGSSSHTQFGHNQTSTGGLVNVSPSIGLGDVNVLNGLLNGTSVLNGSAILSGNTVSGILNGNNTGNGILSGIGVGVLGGNSILNRKSYKLGR